MSVVVVLEIATNSRQLFTSAETLIHYLRGSMPKSKTEKLRKLALKRQFVTAKDTGTLGVPRTYLHRLAHRGQLEKIARGLYASPDFSPTEHASLIEATYQ